ncbi:MAG: universal stress protein [Streptosporangiaceae bacterium]|jgi:nucleotide-binding universal stress UspA family protein
MTTDAGPSGRRIMVGIDGSAAAAAALCWAFREAALRDAVLHVVHVWEPAARGRAPYAPGPCGPGPDAARHEAEALLAAVVRHAHHAAGLDGSDRPGLLLEAVEGLPAKELLNRAYGAELLVLGGLTAAQDTGGRRPVDHISPVALACLRAAPCPVVAVASPAEQSSPAERAARSGGAARPSAVSRRGARAGSSAR